MVKTYPLIYEFRLGLGNCTFYVETNKIRSVVKTFEEIPSFYLIAATWGKFQGVACSAVYSIDSPNSIDNFLEKMVKTGSITDYYLVKENQSVVSKLDLAYYNPTTKTWDKWDWEKWKTDLKSQISQIKVNNAVGFEEDHKQVQIDNIDIEILRGIKKIFHYESASSITYTQLSKKIGYSDSQIRRRIQRLEKEKCLEYLANFEVPKFHEQLFIYILVEGRNEIEMQKILTIFYELPFQISISLESQTKISLFYRATAKELANFLWAIEDLRDYFINIFLQLVPYYYNGRHHLFESYDSINQTWKTVTL
ncbi:MAG: winged helix-turn-helix transcriptional regulator [Asgard group archaeon]|nr:winged helix-turn-helix transcriptional regulator [Asgard group archaeon]